MKLASLRRQHVVVDRFTDEFVAETQPVCVTDDETGKHSVA